MIRSFIKISALVCAAISTVAYADSAEVWVDSYTPPQTIEVKPDVPSINTITHYAKDIPVIILEPLNESKKTLQSRAYKTNNAKTLSTPLNIGVKRAIPDTDTVEKLDSYLKWETLEDGSHIAGLSVISSQALGNRLILDIDKLDPRAELRFTGANSEEVFTVSAEEVINTIFKDKQTNDDQDTNNNLYIGPYLSGEQTTLEIFLPKRVTVDSVELSLPALSHIFLSPTEPELLNQSSRDLSCMVNVACDSSWNYANGIARMLYTHKTGSSYVCTGTLLADRLNTGEPYFLTSSGCINSQELASNLQTFWLYKTDSCYSNTLGSTYTKLTGGADLLLKHDSTKTALLRLHDKAPVGVTYQGWSSENPTNRYVATVHYPNTAPQKVAKGYSGILLADCTYAADGTLSCRGSRSNEAGFLSVKYNRGVTANGSNGSGVFITEKNNQGESKHYLVGQLFTGSSSCKTPYAPDFYGRFDLAFNDDLSKWLYNSSPTEQKSVVSRFYNAKVGSHFLTGSLKERDDVISKYPSYSYEGQAFFAYLNVSSGFSPVYRFYHKTRGLHFYTISESEKRLFKKNYPKYNYEGIAWLAAQNSVQGSHPLYRFYNTKTGAYFYTASTIEKNTIINKYPAFTYEGIAYHVWKKN